MKELYQQDGGAYDEPIQNLTWAYLNPREPTLVELAKEINGYDHATGQLLSSFGQLQDNGGTSSGNWLYTGSYTEAGNMMARPGHRRPDRARHAPRLGLELAGESAGALQPGLGGTPRGGRGTRRGPASPGPVASGSVMCRTMGGPLRPTPPVRSS